MKDALAVLAYYYSERGNEWEKYGVPYYKDFALAVLDFVEIGQGCKVLDIGTGTGLAAFLAASLVGQSGSVTGIDIAEGMISVALEKREKLGIRNLSFRVMDVLSLEFSQESFDTVVSNFGIYTFEMGVFLEIFRILTDGGRLCFNVWSPERPEPSSTFHCVFAKYKVEDPSPGLKNIRMAIDFLSEKASEYEKHPWRIKEILESVGFECDEIKSKTHRLTMPSSEAYVNMMLALDNSREYSEMTPISRKRFNDEVIAELDSLATSDGLVVEYGVNYFIATK